MSCPTCGDSNTEHIRAIWMEYRSAVSDIESIAEAKSTLRTFFSDGDEWTDQDEKIGSAMSALDSVTMTLIDLAGKHKEAHSRATAEHQTQMEVDAAVAEQLNEIKAEESAK